jgi:hypothetical protein
MEIIKIIMILFFIIFLIRKKKEIERSQISKNQKYIEAYWILEKKLRKNIVVVNFSKKNSIKILSLSYL